MISKDVIYNLFFKIFTAAADIKVFVPVPSEGGDGVRSVWDLWVVET